MSLTHSQRREAENSRVLLSTFRDKKLSAVIFYRSSCLLLATRPFQRHADLCVTDTVVLDHSFVIVKWVLQSICFDYSRRFESKRCHPDAHMWTLSGVQIVQISTGEPFIHPGTISHPLMEAYLSPDRIPLPTNG